MATPTTKKIDDLPAIATGTGGDTAVVSRGGVTSKVRLDAFGVPKATALNLAAAGSPSFDPTLLPFSSLSPWRLGIAQDASFAADTDARNVALNTIPNPGSGSWLNWYQFSHPIAFAATTDPLATVADSYHVVGGIPAGGTWQEYIPAAAQIADGTDKHMHVITPDRKDVIEHFATTRVDSTHYNTSRRHRVSLTGSGIGPQNGTRAYGGSAIGGLIRIWEVDSAHPSYTGRIDHPLAMALRLNQLKYTGKAGLPAFGGIYDENGYGQLQGYVWPATEQDGASETAYSGVIPMGSYFAIKPDVDLTTLGLNTSAGMMLAKACQDYGVYMTDATGSTCFYLEESTTGTTRQPAETAFANAVLANNAHDLQIIVSTLKVVTSNGPSTPNGGTLGAPRRGMKSASGTTTVSDATAAAKGVVQLAGDLAGTAASPTVPGLAGKAPLASPALTGTPTVPTAATGTTTTQAASTAFVKAAIDALVNGAPAALDTLQEIAAQLGNDETAAAAITALVDARAIIGTNALTVAATLVGARRNTLDGSGGAFTATLPAPSKVGQLLLLDRIDASTTTTITVSGAAGATLRGNAGGTFALPGVGVAGEGALLVAESLTSWTIAGSIKPKAWLDAVYAQVLEPVTTANSGTAVTLAGLGVNDVTLTGNAALTFPALPSTGQAKTIVVVLRQDATGGRTVTWPGTVKWAGAVPPVLSTGAGKIDVFTFTSIDAATWLGFTGGLDIR